MRLSVDQFRATKNKSITLLGMSGVGKTYLANILRKDHWFHYSGDYRIGTRYLDEAILDHIKQQAMQVPFLRDLLRSDSIYICNNLTVDHLKPVSSFLGKLGNPEKGGLPLAEFKRRQALHEKAEVAAMMDVPEFMRKAHEVYGYQHFVNDAGGSVCELENDDVVEVLNNNTIILYIKATQVDVDKLMERAMGDPKPLYYREEFLDEQLKIYLQKKQHSFVSQIDPDDFVCWIFPRLYKNRLPRYEAIANKYGYTVSSDEISKITSEQDFLTLVETAIARQS